MHLQAIYQTATAHRTLNWLRHSISPPKSIPVIIIIMLKLNLPPYNKVCAVYSLKYSSLQLVVLYESFSTFHIWPWRDRPWWPWDCWPSKLLPWELFATIDVLEEINLDVWPSPCWATLTPLLTTLPPALTLIFTDDLDLGCEVTAGLHTR
jgi:hypothetical protein